MVWYRIVGSGDVRHLRAGTQVAQVRSMRGVASYCAKYMSKTVWGADWEHPGRFWGILNRDALPWGEVLTAEVPTWFAHCIKRWLRRSTGYDYISHLGQTFYLDSPEAWFLRLDAMIELGLSP